MDLRKGGQLRLCGWIDAWQGCMTLDVLSRGVDVGTCGQRGDVMRCTLTDQLREPHRLQTGWKVI